MRSVTWDLVLLDLVWVLGNTTRPYCGCWEWLREHQGGIRKCKDVTKALKILELSVKSCPLGLELHPSFDASPPPGCCLQRNEIVLNKGMKYRDSRLNAGGARTFRVTVHIAGAVIGWRRSGKEWYGKLSLAANVLLNWVSCPLKAQCTFLPCFLKSHPLFDLQGVPESCAVFSWLYR
jgi:hypothetical protein